MRAGFVPDAARFYQQQLEQLGAWQRMVLVERRQLGDDRVYTYELTFPNAKRWVRVALAPDDKVSAFGMRARP